MEGDILAVINDGEVTFIINVNGLTLVSSDLPFAEGDKVFIKDPGPLYSMWDTLVSHMSTAIPDGEEVRHKWTSSRAPSDDEVGGASPKAVFTVKWIGHHISRPNEDVVTIISNGTNVYVMSVRGLAEAGEKSWDKYIIYVRNWAVVNKDSAQSVRDATGPKLFTEWLNNKS